MIGLKVEFVKIKSYYGTNSLNDKAWHKEAKLWV